ncbi:hypothetical protein VNI00_019077 [Paramarasmius palmivorus]|uniref:DUF6589 domain-containing protein n=1 Tax=Paramarasmius palmivorus TaxID=297713 RepID=A0AAW0AQ94_9AGAR
MSFTHNSTIQDDSHHTFDWNTVQNLKPNDIEEDFSWDDFQWDDLRDEDWERLMGSYTEGYDPNASDSDMEPEDDPEDVEMDDGADDDTEEEHETIYVQRTRLLKERLASHPERPANARVRRVLEVLEEEDMDIAIFLDLLSWGDLSQELSGILQRWARPPRSRNQKKKRASGGRRALVDFAREVIREAGEDELRRISPPLQTPSVIDVKVESLTKFDFESKREDFIHDAPILSTLIEELAVPPHRRHAKRPRKSDSKMLVLILSLLAYSRNHRNNSLQKMLAVYFKFQGASAKAFDTLHALGLTMSFKWTTEAVPRMSQLKMGKVRVVLRRGRHAWQLTYDNLEIAFRVFSKRILNLDEFMSGTACTVYIRPSAIPLPPEANRLLKEKRAEGLRNPLSGLDFFRLANEAQPFIDTHAEHIILEYLLQNPDFDLDSYEWKGDRVLTAPPPVRQLPTGTEHITEQYLLGTVPQSEASYEDHIKLIPEWLSQLELNSDDTRRDIADNCLLFFIGDQLTVSRLRGLYKQRAEDTNSFERYDWLVSPFGWFHFAMNAAATYYKQYLGSDKGKGLKASFNLLERKGLKVQTKGVSHHHLNEALHHISEAHILECWLVESKLSQISDLRSLKPKELKSIAARIRDQHASLRALDSMRSQPETTQDEVKMHFTMFLRDIIPYLILRRAMSSGDVGMLEKLIPGFLPRFLGAGHGNYATECIELLQCLHREWPHEVAEYVRLNCWLLTSNGRTFLAYDHAQEHNIKDLKVTYRSQGPHIDWKYLKMLHPAIPTIRSVADHIENQFETYTRGKRHTVPKKEADVRRLLEAYHGTHTQERGRKIGKKDKGKDFLHHGVHELLYGKWLSDWHDGRYFVRATSEEWD